jgi:hypothetical protein
MNMYYWNTLHHLHTLLFYAITYAIICQHKQKVQAILNAKVQPCKMRKKFV